MMGTPEEKAAAGYLAAEGNASPRDSGPEGDSYEIRVRGHLGPEWADWLDGLELTPFEDGQMLLSGRIPDQAALVGVLTRLSRLNMALLSLKSLGE